MLWRLGLQKESSATACGACCEVQQETEIGRLVGERVPASAVSVRSDVATPKVRNESEVRKDARLYIENEVREMEMKREREREREKYRNNP